MKCSDCGCYWQDEDESYPTCHYEGPDDWSPCVQADEDDRRAREEAEYEDFKRQIEEEYAEEVY